MFLIFKFLNFIDFKLIFMEICPLNLTNKKLF